MNKELGKHSEAQSAKPFGLKGRSGTNRDPDLYRAISQKFFKIFSENHS